ncbi:zinc finger AN1 domain-containing stress-associated protein 15-like [Canna indica]|uniref:Zinc finger AN1 domain-containing stress-associated protein 15-like n=1 Tax=Canna indica TaxID=4628 RepID=A0AAQ3L4A7_9LILI|nr:zinc finger AN1 domain-containing stress-associated protein 15-like [Canna indica]
MAGERCNLNKDEAEILKPSSSSPSRPPPPSSAQASLLLKPTPQEVPAPERPERLEAPLPSISCPPEPDEESRSLPTVQPINRCLICRKRVRLTGFRCRCGDLFCARHRYSDAHDCSFDYKAAGREQIAKANPLIRAAKIIKI